MPMPTYRALTADVRLPVTRPEIVHTLDGPSGTCYCVHNGERLHWATDLVEAHKIRRELAREAWNASRVMA